MLVRTFPGRCAALHPGNASLWALSSTLLVIVLCLFGTLAYALDFPALTGRVVDQANVMTAESRADD